MNFLTERTIINDIIMNPNNNNNDDIKATT